MTPEQAIRGIDNLIKEVKKIQDSIELFAASQMQAVLLDRIFNQKRNTAGKSLGKYSKAWLAKRLKNKRQGTDRDLNFTGTLFLALRLGQENGRWACGFVDSNAISLESYNAIGQIMRRKSKATIQKSRGVVSRSKQRAKVPKQKKPTIYPGTLKLSYLLEENLDMLIFTPGDKEVQKVLRDTQKYSIDRFTTAINKFLKQ